MTRSRRTSSILMAGSQWPQSRISNLLHRKIMRQFYFSSGGWTNTNSRWMFVGRSLRCKLSELLSAHSTQKLLVIKLQPLVYDNAKRKFLQLAKLVVATDRFSLYMCTYHIYNLSSRQAHL